MKFTKKTPKKSLGKFTKKELIEKSKIKKWQNGSHYFAKLPDKTDVVVDGNVKWDTYEEAQEAVKKYVESNY